MRKNYLALVALFLSIIGFGQNKVDRPKLVVGIIVDQMRWDYLYRYANRYAPDGFNRLLKKGFSCENTFIPYTPTVTALGHTCTYTGSVPALHGIVSNEWYSRKLKRSVYCTEDSAAATVGSNTDAGKMSPRNLLVTTITDELKLATHSRSKTIGIALKDRGAILPAGHMANAAYWYDSKNGNWITSDFYMKTLPRWVTDFNEKNFSETYMNKDWNTMYPVDTYTQSTSDSKNYEGSLGSLGNTFPYKTSGLPKEEKNNLIRVTPYGNTITTEFAKAAIEAEKLGKGAETDFIAISYSSPDYIGHNFGPNSIEQEDDYLRLDKELSGLFQYLDSKVGSGQYLVFLTADHGAAHVPEFAIENKIPGGRLKGEQLKKGLNDALEKKYGIKGLEEHAGNYQIYLNHDLITQHKLSLEEVKQFVISYALKLPGISNAIDMANASNLTLPEKIKTMIFNGYNQKESGDIQLILNPQWLDGGGKTGTSHGLWNPYDSHIPLLWYGWNVKSGKSNREVHMTDIAPTLSALLHIQMPNGSIGEVITEIVQ